MGYSTTSEGEIAAALGDLHDGLESWEWEDLKDRIWDLIEKTQRFKSFQQWWGEDPEPVSGLK